MKEYIFTNETNSETHKQSFNNSEEAYHWLVNHLDLSLKWSVKEAQEDPYFWGFGANVNMAKINEDTNGDVKVYRQLDK